MPASRAAKSALGMGNPIPIADLQGRNYAGLGMMQTGSLSQPKPLPSSNSPDLIKAADRYTAGLDLLVEHYGSLLDIPEDVMMQVSKDFGFDPPEEYIYGNLAGRDLTPEQKEYIKKTDPERYQMWIRTRRAESSGMVRGK